MTSSEIRIIFKSDKEDQQDRQFSEAENKIAHNAYRLLNGWQTPPGTSANGQSDDDFFKKWLEEVKRLTKESGHLRIALDQVGKVLPYVPPDPDGLWIHRSVAEALNAKDATDMRDGFTCERANMRGVFSPSGGREERQIADGFHKQADALEANGYQRFATAIRELAKRYERDADRESKRNPFE